MFGWKNRSVRALILIMIALTFIGIFIAWLYYREENQSVDPRIRDARLMYENYNNYAERDQYDSIFALMNSIESIYHSIEHYKDSYEIGVLYNNRAASNISIYLQKKSGQADSLASELLKKGEIAAKKSISIYEKWMDQYGDKTETELFELIKKSFLIGLDNYSQGQKQKFLKNRVAELKNAQEETKRRLSVSYTNLGLVKRHQLKYDSAAFYYKKAIDLWDRNLTAENNLNILLNNPIKKRNIIQKLFPPERIE